MKNEEILTVYTTISNCRFGPIKSLRVSEHGDKTEKIKNELERSMQMWKSAARAAQERGDEEGQKFCEKNSDKNKKELATVRTLKTSDYKKELEALLLTGPKEITQDDYWDMLGCLPPLRMGAYYFIMGEFFTDSYTQQFFKKDGKFYVQMIDFKNQETWAKI